MCIALISTAHPEYALILINNRDEFLHRPTASASWWTVPNEHILGGRDLLRDIQGTWLGITKQGRIAVLTNFSEEGEVAQEARSRGAMVNAFLTQPANLGVDTEGFIKDLLEEGQGLKGVGGFSLLCGNVGSRLAVVSNRTPAIDGVTWIAENRGETVGLSNTTIDDRSWYKVLRGEELMSAAIAKSVAHQDTKEVFIEEMMKILSENTLPKRKQGQPLADYMLEFRESIFIPALDGGNEDGVDRENNPMAEGHFKAVKGVTQKPAQHDGLSGVYGTQTQTVVLVDHGGRVTFVERRLYDSAANSIDEAERDKVFEYQIKTDG